jgi:hypothetical protein
MCFGGSSPVPQVTAPPPTSPAPAPVTVKRLQKSSRRVSRAGRPSRRRGAARKDLVIPKTTGVQYSGSGSGVNL